MTASDNPFADPSSTNPFEDSSTSLPSTIHPPASEYASSAALADREAALQRREEEIARREREVAGLVPNNWPPCESCLLLFLLRFVPLRVPEGSSLEKAG